MDRVRDVAPLIEKFEMAGALERFGCQGIVTTSRFMIAPRLRNTRAVYHLMREAFLDAQLNITIETQFLHRVFLLMRKVASRTSTRLDRSSASFA